MALLSQISNNGSREVATSMTSSIGGVSVSFICFTILFSALAVGIIYLMVRLISLAEERKKYYETLNKKLREKQNE